MKGSASSSPAQPSDTDPAGRAGVGGLLVVQANVHLLLVLRMPQLAGGSAPGKALKRFFMLTPAFPRKLSSSWLFQLGTRRVANCALAGPLVVCAAPQEATTATVYVILRRPRRNRNHKRLGRDPSPICDPHWHLVNRLQNC